MAKQKRKQIEKILCDCGKITSPKYDPCCSMNRHYIKFKPMNSVWFQQFSDSIDVDSVDFENKSISGFISNSRFNRRFPY